MDEKAKKLSRAIMRRWLPFKERKTRRAREEAFETIKDLAVKGRNGDFRASATILNISLYLLIAERDIQSVKIETLTHPDEWTRKLCARLIILTIYELDFDKVSGTALNNAMDIGGISNDTRKTVISCLRALRATQKKVQKKYSTIRNIAIAHRGEDAIAQYQAIEDLNVDEVFQISAEFYTAIRVLMDVLPELLTQVGSMPSLLQQLLEANKDK